MTKKRYFQPEELRAVRENCDWRALLDTLGIRADLRRCTDTEFWGYSPFHTEEKTASFHMKDPGIWYDWSRHATVPGRDRPGGGVIELVQAIQASRGQILKLNEAAAWLIDQGFSRGDTPPLAASPEAETRSSENRPITRDLVPQLSKQGTHPAFVSREISVATCHYLRCGYLDTKRGMLAGRIVFQVGGLSEDGTSRVILTHIGRAVTPEQEAKGKWRFYRGFKPSLELYNLDSLILDPEAGKQARDTGRILLVEGAFDVARCIEAGIRNVVGTFGAHLSEEQAAKLVAALSRLSATEVLVFYDRDQAGAKAEIEALALLNEQGVPAQAFDWEQNFLNGEGKKKGIPEAIQDPCDFSVDQLRWLKARGFI